MKCFRILYTLDDTAFMVWAETEDQALEKVRERNRSELTNTDESKSDYKIDAFTPETNDTGMLVFYNVYEVFERNNEA